MRLAAWAAVLTVLALTFLTYAGTLRYQFVYDDGQQIQNNPRIQSWSYLSSYFTNSLWSQDVSSRVRFYRPLFLVWLRVNHALFGLDSSAWHLTTVAAHLLATLFVFGLTLLLLRKWQTAAFAALFFGLHPVHVEVAAWISAVSEALLAAALMGSLICLVKGARSKTHGWNTAALVCYAAALGMKETAIAFPAVVFVYAWLWIDEKEATKRTWIALGRTLPFAALALGYVGIRSVVLKSVVNAITPLGTGTLALSLPEVLAKYGRLLVWPTQLNPMYDTPPVREPGWTNFFGPLLLVVAACGALALLAWKAWKNMRRADETSEDGRVVLLAMAWFAAFLMPPLYLPALQEGMFVQDRYLYVPSAGLAILLAMGISRLGRMSYKVAGIPWVQGAAVLVLAGLMALESHAQMGMWADNVTLYSRAMERDPGEVVSQHNLAASLMDKGRNDEAIALLKKLLTIDPENYADNNNIGEAYLNKGDRVHAEVFLAKACQIHPTPAKLFQLGAVRFNISRYEAAEPSFRQAIAMDQRAPQYHYALGMTLERLGQPERAIEAFEEELAINPGDSRTREELTRLLGQRR